MKEWVFAVPSRESEALILRSYPFREADLVVSFFARDRGKLRGVARGVRRPKSRFGSSLERLAHSRLFYMQKDTLELVRLDRAELLAPPALLRADYPTSAALDLIAETAERLLPAHEPSDAHFRLLTVVVEEFRRGIRGQAEKGVTPDGGLAGWAQRALLYYLLWAVRLGGWLPALDRCIVSGEPLPPDRTVYFSRSLPGLFAERYNEGGAWAMAPESRRLAARMLRAKPAEIAAERGAAPDLQRFLLQRAEAQCEGPLHSAAALEALS